MKVSVTGGTGFIACEVISQLIEKGYQVRTTVRKIDSLNGQELKSLFPSVELFEADLLEPGSFDRCFEGVDFVLHTASPFLSTFNDPQKDLVDPAVNGTLNVLHSIEKNLYGDNPTIKRVVVTSSVAAVVHQIPPDDRVWSEDDWNTGSSLTAGPYRLSKYLAEKAAWDWAKGKEDKVKLLTVNPSFVLGAPKMNRADAESVKTLKKILDGTMKATGAGNGCFGMVDVRNVAAAHIACLEKENASGRYIVSSLRGYTHLELAEILKKTREFSHYPLPEHLHSEVTYRPQMNRSKAEKELGIEFIALEQTLPWMARRLVEFGIVPKLELITVNK